MKMMAVDHARNAEFKGTGCNLSVTVSDGAFVDNDCTQLANDSPKKMGFLGNLIRRNSSPKNEKKPKSAQSWPNIFTKKPSPDKKKLQADDEDMAKFIEELELEGRTEAEIKLHLSHIVQEVKVSPAPSPKGNTNSVAQWFREVQQSFREEFAFINPYYDDCECDDTNLLTLCLSATPFPGALSDIDMTYEELSSLEPVYVGSKCANNLPTCKHDGSPLPGDQTDCPVCLYEFKKGDQLKSLHCVHFFHKDCIDSWLMVGHTCPVCKSPVE
jgi:hypothetical protein